jgi:hypothetical protein
LDSLKHEDDSQLTLGKALQTNEDYVGTFQLNAKKALLLEGYTCLIENENGTENYRIVALIDVTERERAQRDVVSVTGKFYCWSCSTGSRITCSL